MLRRISQLLGHEPPSLNVQHPDGRPPVKVPVLSHDQIKQASIELFKKRVLEVLQKNKAQGQPPAPVVESVKPKS